MTEPHPTAPLVVVWRVTERCDLGCAFCEYSRHRARPRPVIAPETVLAFGAVLAGYAAQAQRTVHVSFLGGEPMLWRPLRLVAASLKHEQGLSTGLTTNGTLLHRPEVRAHLLADYDQVTVSVDGDAAWHDGCRDAPGLWARLRAGLSALAAAKAARGRGPLLRVNTILMRSNVRALEALCVELAGWGVEAVTFNTLGGTAGEAFYERERLQPDDTAWLRSALPGLRARLAAGGLRLLGGERYLQRLDREARAGPWPVDDCGPGAHYVFIDAAGRAAPCDATLPEYGVPVGGLRNAADVAVLPLRLAQLRQALRAAACADCRSPAVFGKFAEALP